MARLLKIFEWITIPATIIATVFTVLSFFSQPAITDCDGFLIYDILQENKQEVEAEEAWKKAGSYESLTPVWKKITSPTVITDWQVPFISSEAND